MPDKIGVGIVGVAPGRSWGAVAHIPALRALPDYELVALSTTRAESAAAAAAAFGVESFYDNHRDLIANPKVALVAVNVKVPQHFGIVKAAIEARKNIYCEWLLGNGLEETVTLANLARQAGLRTVIGLQARAAPVVGYVRDLVKDGYIGEVLSTTLVGTGGNWGSVYDQPNAYTADKANGATMLTIPFGHTVDALCYCLGEFRSLAATMAVRRATATVAQTGETLKVTAEDQVAVTGTLESGAVAAIHYRGGVNRGTSLLWEINGTKGDLQIRGTGSAQIRELSLFGGTGNDKELQPLSVPERYDPAPSAAKGPAHNVAAMYMRFLADRRDGTHLAPTFDDAVTRHRMVEKVAEAAASGRTVQLDA